MTVFSVEDTTVFILLLESSIQRKQRFSNEGAHDHVFVTSDPQTGFEACVFDANFCVFLAVSTSTITAAIVRSTMSHKKKVDDVIPNFRNLYFGILITTLLLRTSAMATEDVECN